MSGGPPSGPWAFPGAGYLAIPVGVAWVVHLVLLAEHMANLRASSSAECVCLFCKKRGAHYVDAKENSQHR